MPAGSTTERIIAATLELATERGLSGLTMSAVAETANVARQTLYNHFPDVEAIVAAAVEAHQKESFDALRVFLATMDDASTRLEHVVRHVAASAAHHLPMPAVQHGLSAAVREGLFDHQRQLQSLIEAILTDGVAAGDFRPSLDVPRDAKLITHMLDAVTEQVGANPEAIGEIVGVATRTVRAAVANSE